MFSSKRKRCLAGVSVFLLVAALFAGTAGCNYAPPSKDLQIWDWYDLDDIRDNLAGHHVLMNDLDSTTSGYQELASAAANGGKGWEPIGTETDPFTGALDGKGHDICDLNVNRPDTGYVGLFGFANEGGIIKSVGVVNASVTGYIFVGSLVGVNVGTVGNSYSTGSVTGTGNEMFFGSAVGGLLGLNGGAVSNSYSTGSMIGEAAVGGLVGVNVYGALGTVSNSYSSGNVTGDEGIGGLVGVNGGAVSDCYSNSNVTGVHDVGGLVGFADGGVHDSFWDVQTSGQNISAGGTGMNTTQMQDIVTFSNAGWNIIAVALNETDPAYIWNIVTNVTYPFLSWQSA